MAGDVRGVAGKDRWLGFPSGWGVQITGLSERAGEPEERMDLTEKTGAVRNLGCLGGGRVADLKE